MLSISMMKKALVAAVLIEDPLWQPWPQTDALVRHQSRYQALPHPPQKIFLIVVLLADYQYKSAFCADQEINNVAALTEIMITAE